MKRTLFVLALALIGCPSAPPPKPPTPTPTPVVDAGVVTCDAYCGHLRKLDCVGAQPTPKGASCEAVCANIEDSGYVQNTRECSMRASTCDEVDDCEE